ncbi:hypothetical protein ACI8AC_12685 [Geodermatophilus sp. SYSU D00758]
MVDSDSVSATVANNRYSRIVGGHQEFITKLYAVDVRPELLLTYARSTVKISVTSTILAWCGILRHAITTETASFEEYVGWAGTASAEIEDVERRYRTLQELEEREGEAA